MVHSYQSYKYLSSHGGLEVEQWSDNRTLSISVDQSPLGAYMTISANQKGFFFISNFNIIDKKWRYKNQTKYVHSASLKTGGANKESQFR